jgi:hypothetical protein
MHPRDYLDNWRASDAAFPAKSRIAARNTLRRLTRWKRCCGHPGEPGC